jgi:outer membrane protein OmpA-like peptidoglycan-associated protein
MRPYDPRSIAFACRIRVKPRPARGLRLQDIFLVTNSFASIAPPSYVQEPQLLKLAEQALGVTGYVIQVKGYVSKVGSAALNQKLSTERANAVTQFLEHDANVPLTNMLAPGAMGTADQVAPDKTSEGQAENRRVVVMILQNKGIAGN